MPRIRTIAELRRALANSEKQLATLAEQRKKAATALSAIDRKIAALSGAAVGAPPTKKAAKKTRKVGRHRGKPLAEYIADVLGKARGGVRVKDIVKAVVESGYHTKSKDFYNSVAATLTADKRFDRTGRGVYKLR
jgi:hypothetical protein